MVSLVAKIEYVIINSNWMQEFIAGPKKKLRYSEETPWFPDYYIASIEIGNCDQETLVFMASEEIPLLIQYIN